MKRFNISLMLVFIACTCWINSAFAQVTFQDDALEAAVRSALRLGDMDDILDTELQDLTRLTATRKNIIDLTGLEEATGLEHLDLGDNAIVNFDPLANLSRLENLDLADNEIVNLPGNLSGMSSLENLDLDGNGITNVASLADLSSIEVLDLRDNSVGDVTPLSGLTTLKTLYLRGNADLVGDFTDFQQSTNTRALVKLKNDRVTIDITLPRSVTFRDDNLEDALQSRLGLQDTDPIFPEDMATLTSFNASNPIQDDEKIVNLTGLETATALTTLDLSGNAISSISALSRLTLLTNLDLSGNAISSISALSKLTLLTDLDLSDNEKISSVSSLSKLTSLTDLDLSNNRISSLTSLSGLTSLTDLDLSDNSIRDVLPLQGLSSLTRLDLSGNDDITDEKASVLYKLVQDNPSITITLPAVITLPTNVVIFENDALETAVRSALRISRGYPILASDEKGLDTLTRLTATRKEIDDLSGLEGATALTALDLGQNKIDNILPLGNLTNLETLDLADNAIVNLPPNVPGFNSLTTVDLSGNQIVNLPLGFPSWSNLKTLDLADNHIQNVLRLQNVSSLTRLELQNNDIGDVTPLSGLTALKNLYLRDNANLIDDFTDTRQRANTRHLVKLKNARVTIDITLPRPVTIRDENLVTELLSALNLQTGDPIFSGDMETLTTFTASGQSIDNLTGFETATGLTTLDLSDNDIVSISPLSKLVALETLNLSDNDISSISSLSKLTLLTDLDLSDNEKISSISVLSKLTSLTTLDLSNNRISSLTSLSGLTSLETLDLSDNSIRDVLPLQGLSSLRTLNLTGNDDITNAAVLYRLRPQTTITGVTVPEPSEVVSFPNAALETAVRSALRILRGHPIMPGDGEKQLGTLTRLTATRKDIDDLTGLEGATALTTLDLGDNMLVNLEPLRNLTALTSLDLADNGITDFSPLTGLSDLESLDLDGNQIVNLPSGLSGLSSLETLDLSYNQIQDISPFTGLSVPETLDLRNNNVGDVTPLTTMTNLEKLYLRGNADLTNVKLLVKLKAAGTSIDITLPRAVTVRDDNLLAALLIALNRLPNLNLQDDDPIFPEDMARLTTFTASSQSIDNLTGLETATGLTTLDLSDNDIVSISPLSKLVALETLNLSDNDISSISSLSKLTNLTDLDLSDNEKISSVSSLSKLTLLTDLDLSNNRISSLTPLSGLTGLETLDLSDNSIRDVLPLQGLSSLTRLDLSGNTGITNAMVLYRLRPQTTITLPPGMTVPGPGDVVVFANTALETAVRSALGITRGHPILPTGDDGLDTLTRLTATRKDIDDLIGLEGATALTTLDLGQNDEISDLSPLQNLTTLTSLDLADNKIVNLGSLTGLTALTTLNLADNQITSVSDLPSLTALERLDLRDNNVGDVTPLSTMTHLDYLYLRGNANLTNVKLLVKLKDAGTRLDITLPRAVNIPDSNLLAALLTQLTDPIVPADMQGLTSLIASGRSISDLTGLETATALTSLTLSNNDIEDLEPLEDLTSLTDLNLSDNDIEDLEPLEALTTLETLDLRNNQITDVAPLAELTSLTQLDLTGNSITNPGVLYNLDQQTTTTITGVTVPSAVTITDTNLEAAVKSALRIATADPILPDAMATLTRLTASRKGITSLSGLETAGLLEKLDVGQNEISDLNPISGLTLLETLDLAKNNITNISLLSGLTNLKTLDLRNNSVTDVEPLMDLTSLRQIYLRGNTITNLAWLGALENLRADITLPDVVSIPDTNLDSVVRTALSVTGTLPMSEELLESLTTLTASSSGIADLTGCEHMTGLTSLDLQNNQITDVTPLSKLTSLVTLKLAGNTILDTSPLYRLTLKKLTDVDIPIYRYPSWDVNQDGRVNKVDLYLITLSITGSTPDINDDGNVDTEDETAVDVNRDNTRDINDLRFVFDYLDRPVNLGAPLLTPETAPLEASMLEQIEADGVRVQLQILRMTNDGSRNYRQTLVFLQAILAAIQPNQTLLLANYPNPFNPETWIPYILGQDSYVRITIYDAQGAIVRRLELGYRSEGYYTTRGRAAHWDGRNDVGERVASGIYFYQLETENVSLLRKMVILK